MQLLRHVRSTPSNSLSQLEATFEKLNFDATHRLQTLTSAHGLFPRSCGHSKVTKKGKLASFDFDFRVRLLPRQKELL